MRPPHTVVPVLTGVIYGAIVVVWAAYLVPLALRRHDEASRTRSVERFSSAMRILARRGTTADAPATAGSRVVVTPERGQPRVLAPESGRETERVLMTPRRNRAAERVAAARRRRVLAGLVGLTVLIAVVSVLGVIPVWSVILPLLLTVVFLVVAHRTVSRASEPRWVEAPAAEQSSSVVVRRAAARVDSTPGDETSEGYEDEPTITVTGAQRKAAPVGQQEPAVATVSAMTADGGSLWDPLPVTLPTYVDAAVAMRTFRTIQLGEPGTWSSGHATDDAHAAVPAAAMASHAASADDDDDEITQEVPRVVNG